MAQLSNLVGIEFFLILECIDSTSITKKKFFCVLCVPELCLALEIHRLQKNQPCCWGIHNPSKGTTVCQQQLSWEAVSTTVKIYAGDHGGG